MNDICPFEIGDVVRLNYIADGYTWYHQEEMVVSKITRVAVDFEVMVLLPEPYCFHRTYESYYLEHTPSYLRKRKLKNILMD
jgi:hypothetical protein